MVQTCSNYFGKHQVTKWLLCQLCLMDSDAGLSGATSRWSQAHPWITWTVAAFHHEGGWAHQTMPQIECQAIVDGL